ncbi:MAG: hypothetical protein A3I68_09200 [Candidatus Melainabacteria bacterium RIFCSPLOWO2_02_FULL_35_15]|nr:MAG: hypothetical protein A3I68_09200 [Candidatus Melainabacteria bacterium RIFCSPLOWO2_02_FULL_35_15]
MSIFTTSFNNISRPIRLENSIETALNKNRGFNFRVQGIVYSALNYGKKVIPAFMKCLKDKHEVEGIRGWAAWGIGETASLDVVNELSYLLKNERSTRVYKSIQEAIEKIESRKVEINTSCSEPIEATSYESSPLQPIIISPDVQRFLHELRSCSKGWNLFAQWDDVKSLSKKHQNLREEELIPVLFQISQSNNTPLDKVQLKLNAGQVLDKIGEAKSANELLGYFRNKNQDLFLRIWAGGKLVDQDIPGLNNVLISVVEDKDDLCILRLTALMLLAEKNDPKVEQLLLKVLKANNPLFILSIIPAKENVENKEVKKIIDELLEDENFVQRLSLDMLAQIGAMEIGLSNLLKERIPFTEDDLEPEFVQACCEASEKAQSLLPKVWFSPMKE